MKKIDWYRIFSLADDKYVAEAFSFNASKTKRSTGRISVLAACACLLLFLNLWLFIPHRTTPPSVSRYEDSEYYGVICQLNELTFEQPRYKNNAAMILASIKALSPPLAGDSDPSYTGSKFDSEYREITDNQVAGVIEADRIKRSDTHIYYLDDTVLRIYSIAGESTAEVGSYEIVPRGKHSYLDTWEFYLSGDCKTVTVVTQYYESSLRHVRLISLDVSDPAAVTERDSFDITGKYLTSRKTDGSILLLTEFVVNKQTLDFDDESTFLPRIDEGDGARTIPASSINSPEALNSARYTVVMKLDELDLQLRGTAAYLSYSEEAYVSEEHVFLTNAYTETAESEDGLITATDKTEISCLTYGGDAFEGRGRITVDGALKDQWSMDEYEGILRVFTTTNTRVDKPSEDESDSRLQLFSSKINASLYCIDLSSFEIVASVIDFAPAGEVIKSVRFDKELAYVCTLLELSEQVLLDPVFFFDLSDLNNITSKDTGTIEGFSTSLINFGDGYLLGIGRGGSSNFKIEVYEETEDGVRSVCSFEPGASGYSTEYKSYYVDRENKLVGIGIVDRWLNEYLLLHFDGYEIVKLVEVSLDGDTANMRGVYIDGYMYMFGKGEFKVKKVFD